MCVYLTPIHHQVTWCDCGLEYDVDMICIAIGHGLYDAFREGESERLCHLFCAIPLPLLSFLSSMQHPPAYIHGFIQ